MERRKYLLSKNKNKLDGYVTAGCSKDQPFLFNRVYTPCLPEKGPAGKKIRARTSRDSNQRHGKVEAPVRLDVWECPKFVKRKALEKSSHLKDDSFTIRCDIITAEGEEFAMAQHLLVAADKYRMERLKLICEDKLCKNIAAGTAASILALAEVHHCHELKGACFHFLSSPKNLTAAMAGDDFENLRSSFHSLVKELIAKCSIDASAQ
ncbi:hypothetical protein VPH35_058723 [Triticum aestivum]